MEFIPVTFHKSYEERLDEYNKIFNICECTDGDNAAGVKEIWSTYLEISIGQFKCWYAIWNLSRQQCSEYNLPFPCMVVVDVSDIDFVEMKATLRVKYVEDAIDEHFPSVVTVALKDLYPTLGQCSSVASYSIKHVAECIDQMRLFFNYLWRPWDENENPIEWSRLYLETRLRLYFSMNFPSDLSDFAKHEIHSVIKETKETYNRVQSLIEECVSTETLPDYVEYLSKQCSLMYKLDLLEDSETRCSLNKDVIKCFETNGIIVVKEDCSLQQYLKHMEKLQEIVEPVQYIKYTTSNLQEGLLRTNINSMVVITSGRHKMKNICYIKYGGYIQGLYSDNRPIISDDQPDKALIVCRSEETVTLRHLIFEIVNCNDIMVVLAGIAAMHDVFIQSVNKRKIISVYSGAKLTADCCEFQGTTIVCFPGAAVCLTRCVFQDDMLAVKVHKEGQLNISDCTTSTGKQPIVEYSEEL